MLCGTHCSSLSLSSAFSFLLLLSLAQSFLLSLAISTAFLFCSLSHCPLSSPSLSCSTLSLSLSLIVLCLVHLHSSECSILPLRGPVPLYALLYKLLWSLASNSEAYTHTHLGFLEALRAFLSSLAQLTNRIWKYVCRLNFFPCATMIWQSLNWK